MGIEQTQAGNIALHSSRRATRGVSVGLFLRIAMIGLCLVLLAGSAIPAETARRRTMAMAVAGWGFDLVGWEIDAVGDKLAAMVGRPASELTPEEGAHLVRDYMARAAQIDHLERELRRIGSEANRSSETWDAIQDELSELRATQFELRPAVEQVIEGQVTWVLKEAGFGVGALLLPPVQFAFTDPPKKLVVSPRDRIETIYGRMVDGAIPLREIEQAEAKIDGMHNASAYVTEIGGLGAYPTMVVDHGSLAWVLSTVAHEWVHNHLVFFPLGWSYFSSQDLTTLNETVAEIVGNEIGDRVLQLFYPELWQPPEVEGVEQAPPSPEPDDLSEEFFDFAGEMRLTRLEVDRLLAAGAVEQAEEYMEMRRRQFVEAGYPLRVLNQAYFAFHGSYGTSAASTSPTGPRLEYLRSLMPDVETFLTTVRFFTSLDDLDRAIAAWETGER